MRYSGSAEAPISTLKKPQSPSPTTARSDTTSRLVVRVQPRASQNRLSARADAGWKIALTAPPIEGKANRACLEFLAKILGVPRSSLHIVRGQTARQKTIEVQGLSDKEVDERLKAAEQR